MAANLANVGHLTWSKHVRASYSVFFTNLTAFLGTASNFWRLNSWGGDHTVEMFSKYDLTKEK